MCLFVASCSERGGVWTPFLRTQWLLQASSLWPPDYKTLTLVNQDRTHLGHTARFHNMKADCSAKQTSCSAALTVWSWIFASEFSSWHWLLPRQRSHRSTSSWFLVPSPRRDKSGLWKRWTECRCTNFTWVISNFTHRLPSFSDFIHATAEFIYSGANKMIHLLFCALIKLWMNSLFMQNKLQ